MNVLAQELLWQASREMLTGNTTKDELLDFITEQISNPFVGDNINYFKKYAKLVSSQDELDEISKELFTKIEDVYPNLTIDVSDYDQHYGTLCGAIYKFFVKNATKLMYTFIKQFLYNNKKRKVLTEEFNSSKLSGYPKEQYGKKEYYILIAKLQPIVDEIFSDDVELTEYIDFITRSDDVPVYLEEITAAIDNGILIDHGVVGDMYKLFRESDAYRSVLNKLERDITNTFILPYLQDNNMLSVRLPPIEIPMDEEELDDDEEEGEDDY